MRIKSKKGAVLLIISSLAFLLTVFLLADYQLKADFLGQKQVGVLEIASQGENVLMYIDQMAKLSLAEAWGSKHPGRIRQYVFSEECRASMTVFDACKQEFKKAFESRFQTHLKTFNELYGQDLKYELEEKGIKNFEIIITPYSGANPDELGGFEIVGKADKKITLEKMSPEKGKIRYSIKPNFHIKLSLEALDLLKGPKVVTEESSLEYFQDYVNDLKKCAAVTDFPHTCPILDLERIIEGDKIRIENTPTGIKFSYYTSDGAYRGIIGFDTEIKTEAGLICYGKGTSYKKKFGVDDCTEVYLTAKKSDISKCCEDPEEWKGKTKLYFIKETDGVLYLTTRTREEVEAATEEERKEKETAYKFFEEVVEILQRCAKITGDKSCICDNSLFEPQVRFLEGYTIKLEKVEEKKYLASLIDEKETLFVRTIEGGRIGSLYLRNKESQMSPLKCLPGVVNEHKIEKYQADYTVIFMPNNLPIRCFIGTEEHNPREEDLSAIYLAQESTGLEKCSAS